MSLRLSNIQTIAIAETKSRLEGDSRGVEDVLYEAMLYTKDHWLVTDENQRLMCAVGATMLHFGEGSEEFVALENEVKFLGELGRGIFHNAPQSLIGIIPLWKKANGVE